MIYKKASDLAICGAEIGIVVLSPTGKPFTFGIPTIEALVERFLNRNTPEQPLDDGGMKQKLEAQQRTRIEKLRQNINKTLFKLEAETKHEKSLKQIIKAAREANVQRGEVGWWDAKIEALTPAQLEQVSASIEQFYGDLMKHMKKGSSHNHNPSNNNGQDSNNVVTSTDSLLEALNFDDDNVSGFEIGNEAYQDGQL
ncbi:hypothetical protein CDL15_Pgr023493 [Punica granatum]|nr:hypothetical protein CDL15_Pgr023493 [Punica granatum]PKI59619.1 hypothetical protein CRG98_020028 [Punica granatum]